MCWVGRNCVQKCITIIENHKKWFKIWKWLKKWKKDKGMQINNATENNSRPGPAEGGGQTWHPPRASRFMGPRFLGTLRFYIYIFSRARNKYISSTMNYELWYFMRFFFYLNYLSCLMIKLLYLSTVISWISKLFIIK